MGFSYSYEMWVPQERLYNFLELINEMSDMQEWGGTTLYWPDGRLLKFSGSSYDYNASSLIGKISIAFDCDMHSEFFYTGLLFTPDDRLSHSYYPYPVHKSGKYIISISVHIDFNPENPNWLDEEGAYALVSLSGSSKSTCTDIAFSDSVREAIIDLARKGGAVSCSGDYSIFYLDGKEMCEEWEGVDYPEYSYRHFRDMRHYLNPTKDLTESEKQLLVCQHSDELSLDDVNLRLDWAKNAKDSGVRGAAIKSLSNWVSTLHYYKKAVYEQFRVRENSLAEFEKVRTQSIQSLEQLQEGDTENLLCTIALNDRDWRVRYVATHSLENFTSTLSENTLFEALRDESYDVQAIAIKTLGDKKNLDRDLAEELANFITHLPFWGASSGAFLTALKVLVRVGKPYHAQIIRQRMSEPYFPFEQNAKDAIKRLESKI